MAPEVARGEEQSPLSELNEMMIGSSLLLELNERGRVVPSAGFRDLQQEGNEREGASKGIMDKHEVEAEEVDVPWTWKVYHLLHAQNYIGSGCCL
ncbi:hypothetical protein YC2023_008556 [Brassica napus]